MTTIAIIYAIVALLLAGATLHYARPRHWPGRGRRGHVITDQTPTTEYPTGTLGVASMSTKEPFTLPHGVRSYRAVEDLGERTPAGVYAASSLASLVGSPVIDETGKAYESSTIVDAQGNGTNVTATVRLPSRAVGETLGLDDPTRYPRLAPECSGECYRAARLGPGCNGVCQRAYPDYEGPCSPLPRPAIVDVVAAVETPHRPAPFAVDTKEATLARDAVRDAVRQHRHGGHALADAWRAALTGALAATRTGTPTDRARDAMAVADAVVLELMEATP